MMVGIMSAKMAQLGGFDNEALHSRIKEQISNKMAELKAAHPDMVLVTSLALGPETWAAEIALQYKIPYHVYIPYDKPYNKWPKPSVNDYLFLVKNAAKKVVLSKEPFSVALLKDKESKIIAACDLFMLGFPVPEWTHKAIKKAGKPFVDILPETTEEDDDHIPF